jgi:hypothetical protein
LLLLLPLVLAGMLLLLLLLLPSKLLPMQCQLSLLPYSLPGILLLLLLLLLQHRQRLSLCMCQPCQLLLLPQQQGLLLPNND